MKPTDQFLEHEILKAKLIGLKMVNGLLAIGTFHYLSWIVYELFKWIT